MDIIINEGIFEHPLIQVTPIHMLQLRLLENLSLPLRQEAGRTQVWDIIRKKWVQLQPEEHVRQALLHFMVDQLQYPAGLISVEKQINYGELRKRYDIIVFDRKQQPWMIVECKAPDVDISEQSLHQLLQYHSQLPCPYWLLSNGISNYCAAHQDYQIQWLQGLPEYPRD